MEEKAGAFIWIDGILIPDLDDEAMAARQALSAAPPDAPPLKNKKTQPEAPAEVTNAEK
jgi:hypothetical protein